MQAGLAPFFMRPPARQKPNASNNRGGVLELCAWARSRRARGEVGRTMKRRFLRPISVTRNGT